MFLLFSLMELESSLGIGKKNKMALKYKAVITVSVFIGHGGCTMYKLSLLPQISSMDVSVYFSASSPES